MRKQFLIPVLVGILALGAAPAFAQSATVVMRNGDRVQAQLLDMGREIVIGVNGQTRRVPIGDVVLIDFAGNGRDISSEELSRANAANGYVVMRNGETFNASLQDLTGKPLIAVFSNGRRANLGEVSRIYLNSVANVAGFPNQPSGGQTSTSGDGGSSNAPSNARTVVVPANVAWSNTGINVTRGQNLRFDATGEIRLSFNGDDVARPMGAVSGRLADKAPLPNVPAGALIGRINNGPPFSIGTNAVPIPENGRLLLGINDDHVADNSGNFTVRIWEP